MIVMKKGKFLECSMNFRMEVIGYEDEKRVYRNAFGRG